MQVWPIVGSVLYVVNRGNDSITVYPNSRGGNVAPTIVIAGARTTLKAPASLQLDAGNAIWVANFGSDAVLKFAAGANGNVAPILRLAGAKTGLHSPNSLHYAFRSGDIYVLNRGSNSVEVFAKASQGNVAPKQLIAGPKTGLREPGQLELDSKGNIWVANTGARNVLEFSPGATGDIAPINVLTLAAGAFRPSGLAFDASDNLTVGDASQNTLYEFAASGTKGKATPIAIVRGSRTGLRSPQRLGVPQTIATPMPGT
jgi:DNA-binding beta-propeller fold protein YncE